VAKALVGHFVAPDPVAAAQVRALTRRVAALEERVLLLQAELAARDVVVPDDVYAEDGSAPSLDAALV
jgi:hypothetical protein